MKRSLLLGLFMIGAGLACAQGQETIPVVEAGLNYSLLHTTSASGGNQITSNGGSGYVVYNLNRGVGLMADFGSYHNGTVHGTFNSDTTFTYLFGPRFSWRRWSRITPYTQFLFGGATVFAAFPNPGGAAPASNESSFALEAGGGIDVALTRHIAIKPIQVDYLMTQAPNFAGSLDRVQNGVRYSAGVVLRLGRK